ncbi:MAG: hypothetical protein KGH89_03690 [Thaumarchaeota archaeon]|nr:hypothetical protein [Nitrososphaerota archaeon]
MEFHPSQIPISKTFEVSSEIKAPEIADEMVKTGFTSQKGGFRVIMTKEKDVAKKIGFTIMNELNLGLRKAKQERDVRYWIYSYDQDHFAMVLISSKVLSELGF